MRPRQVGRSPTLASSRARAIAHSCHLAARRRSEPNENPVLPKPVGRLSFTLNPFSLLYQVRVAPSTLAPSAVATRVFSPTCPPCHRVLFAELPCALFGRASEQRPRYKDSCIQRPLRRAQLLGPKLCKRLAGLIAILICFLLLYYMLPVIIGNVFTAPITG